MAPWPWHSITVWVNVFSESGLVVATTCVQMLDIDSRDLRVPTRRPILWNYVFHAVLQLIRNGKKEMRGFTR